MKILIVEDEIDLLLALNNFLIKEGYLCELADNFGKAYDKLSINEYDLILLDITLQDANGLELLPVIKKNNPKSGVIILSAKNSLDDKIVGLDRGADDYLTKPFQLSELNSRIKAVLRRRKFDGTALIKFNEISINTDSKTVRINEHTAPLKKKIHRS